MPYKEELAELFSSPEFGPIMAAIFLLVLMVARYHVKKWLQSIEDTRKAVFGSNETTGLKTIVNALEKQGLEDRKDIDQMSAKIDHNHEQLLESLKSITEHISSKSEETAGTLGEILGYLEARNR